MSPGGLHQLFARSAPVTRRAHDRTALIQQRSGAAQLSPKRTCFRGSMNGSGHSSCRCGTRQHQHSGVGIDPRPCLEHAVHCRAGQTICESRTSLEGFALVRTSRFSFSISRADATTCSTAALRAARWSLRQLRFRPRCDGDRDWSRPPAAALARLGNTSRVRCNTYSTPRARRREMGTDNTA